MKLKISLLFCLMTSSFFAIAQSDDKIKKYSHLVGLQVNQLIRQVLNFGGNSAAINNPYLLTYSLQRIAKKDALDIGLGYTYTNSFQNDGNLKNENHLNELYLRVGYQTQLFSSGRFTSQFSIHGLFELFNNKTKVEQDFNSQITKVNTKSDIVRYGISPTLGLRYKINDRLFIGTEASYAFRLGTRKSTSTSETIFVSFPSPPQITTTESDNDLTQFQLQLPTAIFAVLRF
jgi:hypothetical protein